MSDSYRQISYKAACRNPTCGNDYFPDKWGRMEATRKGWYIGRNGEAWCWEHIPAWVAERRERKKAEKELEEIRKDLWGVIAGLKHTPWMLNIIEAYTPDYPEGE